MKRMFKTRYFGRWMRKTELTERALCSAVSEMVQGRIDADLGGGVVKNGSALQVEASEVGPEHSLPPTRGTGGSSCTGSRKMIEPTLQTMNWKR